MKILAAITLILWVLTVAGAFYVDKYHPFADRWEDWVRRSTVVALALTVALCGWALM